MAAPGGAPLFGSAGAEAALLLAGAAGAALLLAGWYADVVGGEWSGPLESVSADAEGVAWLEPLLAFGVAAERAVPPFGAEGGAWRRIVGNHSSGMSMPLSRLMLVGCKRIWIASLTRRVYQCLSCAMQRTSPQFGG